MSVLKCKILNASFFLFGKFVYYAFIWYSHRPFSNLCVCPNTEFYLVRIFLYLDWIQENTDQKKLHIWTHFTQWIFLKSITSVYLIKIIVFSSAGSTQCMWKWKTDLHISCIMVLSLTVITKSFKVVLKYIRFSIF